MNYSIQKMSIGLMSVLVIFNVYFFVNTMTFGEKALKIEQALSTIRNENSELEKKLTTVDSIHNLQKRAQQLGFTKKSSLIRIDNLQYALRHE